MSEINQGSRSTPKLQKVWLVGLVVLNRIRFVGILACVCLFIGYWDTVKNYWDKWTHPRQVTTRELEPDYEFFCPMDPQVIRSTYEANGDVPKCPICGMTLNKRKKGESAKLAEGVTGRVQLSPDQIQLAGVKTIPVTFRPMAKQIKTVGYVTFDERGLSRIVSRVDGYVEKLYVDETYTVVNKGDKLAEIYSPEFYSTARELALASKGGSADFVASAKTRLMLLGVSQSEIDTIISSGEPMRTLAIRSPQSGHVVDKKIVVGSSVDAKMTLFDVADLSKVWIEAEVYEQDIPYLQRGQTVEATVESLPNQKFLGKLSLVHPHLETATRTNRVRFELENPHHILRPGMYVSVCIDTPLEDIEPYKSLVHDMAMPANQSGGAIGQRHNFLVVPQQAVVDTGAEKIVYIERAPGIFEGMKVELGPRQGELYPVIKGLKAGDEIVAAGSFLVDAETRLNPSAASTYFGASAGPQMANTSATPTLSATNSMAVTAPSNAKNNKPVLEAPTEADVKALERLAPDDRKLAMAQRNCPISGAALGSMGTPVKITLLGKTIFLCCSGCVGTAKRTPDETLKALTDAAANVH